MKRKVVSVSLKESPTIHPLSGQTTLNAEKLYGIDMWHEGAFIVVNYQGIEAFIPLSNVKAFVPEKGKDANRMD